MSVVWGELVVLEEVHSIAFSRCGLFISLEFDGGVKCTHTTGFFACFSHVLRS